MFKSFFTQQVSSIQGYAPSYNDMTVPKSLRNGNEAMPNEDQRMTYSGVRGSIPSNRFPPKKKEVRMSSN